jgi:hypothetical protein
MATNYPTHIDDTSSLPPVTDNVNRVSADVINRLRAAIIAIESELGVKPSGIYGTVKNRIDGIDALITSLNNHITALNVGSGGAPGGSDTQVQFNDFGVLGGDAGFTYNKTTNLLNLSDALALGLIPSTTGAIRLANSARITARNVGNTANFPIISLDASNRILLGTSDFTWDDTNKNLVIGSGATAAGPNSMAVGSLASASGSNAVALGFTANASSSYSIAIGGTTTSAAAGSVCIGEVSSVLAGAANATSIGLANSIAGIYSSALGSYLTNTASAAGSCLLGLQASASRAGELVHGTGLVNTSARWMDLSVDASTGSESLVDPAGLPFSAQPSSIIQMRVIIAATNLNGTKTASEVRELLISTSTNSVTIINETITSGFAGSLAAAGWSCTIRTTHDMIIDFSCSPGTDSVRFNARLQLSEVGNSNVTTGGSYDPGLLPWSYWLRNFTTGLPGNNIYGASSAGTSGSRFMKYGDVASPAQGSALNGHGVADFTPSSSQSIYNSLDISNFISPTAYTVSFLVYARNPIAPAATIYNGVLLAGTNDSTNASWGIAWSTLGVNAWHYDGAYKYTGWVAMSANAWHRIDVRYDGTNLKIRVDGGAWTSVAAGTAIFGSHTIYIGRNYNNVYADMKIAEFMTATSVISDTDLASTRTSYQFARYGV